ncbi:TPA: capsular polysaccharide synthesis protein [Haemophilus influenzae]|uniref:capsular polysaccharide synthesis protein n=1 Tax=Haemophilus influenzae TaxID=727 RepID=UPI000E570D1C|nr:capsular polysaccharide synthesis protein [Haemophilus influenzae]
MNIKNIAINFSSKKDFLNNFGKINNEKTSLSIINKNEIIIKGKKNDNSLNFTLLKNKKYLKPGKTYTISCDFILNKKISKTLPFDVPKIAFDCTINGKNNFDYQSSSSIPNEVGVWHKSLTVKVPKNCSNAWFRIYVGIEKDAGELLIKNIFISENNFDFIYLNNLFYHNEDNDTFSLLSDFKENYIEKCNDVSYLFRNGHYTFVNSIIKNINDSAIRKKFKLYLVMSKENVSNTLAYFNNIKNELNEQDSVLASDAIHFFARNLEWDTIKDIVNFFDKKGLYHNCIEYLYEKAQLYRRLKDKENELKYYNLALSIDENKNPNINWNLFFDSNNPGLSYRRDELKFILENLSDIQRIADSYPSSHINFKESPVFVFWDQGYDNAPIIVKSIIDRMKIIYGNKLVFLTGETIEAYIDIPARIESFRESKRAFFSDYIRTELLLRYGGTWIDSTVFTTNQFYKENLEILEKNDNNLYVLRIPENPYRISNWFLSTNQTGNRILALMYATMLIFAEKRNSLFEYYQYHTFFEILTQLDKQANEDFHKNYRNNYQPYAHDLLKNFRNDWDRELFNKLIARCPIQKLTYKSNLLHLRTHSLLHLRTHSFYKTIIRNAAFL